MTTFPLNRIIAGLFFMTLMASCSSTTIIDSRPQGAKLYMDGSLMGKTPYSYSDTKIVGSTTSIKLSLDGYSDFNGMLTRSEQLDVGALIGGIFVLVPFLWIMDYNPMHIYELTASGMTTPPDTTNRESALEAKLKDLKKMHDDGTLTDDEYQTLRKKAIDNAK